MMPTRQQIQELARALEKAGANDGVGMDIMAWLAGEKGAPPTRPLVARRSGGGREALMLRCADGTTYSVREVRWERYLNEFSIGALVKRNGAEGRDVTLRPKMFLRVV